MADVTKKLGGKLLEWLKMGALVGIAAGVIAVLLSMILPVITGLFGAFEPIVTSVLALLLLIAGLLMVKSKQIQVLNTIPNFVLLMASVGVVGSIIGILYAPASAFILDVQAVSLGNIAWTLVYIVFGIIVLDKVGLKLK